MPNEFGTSATTPQELALLYSVQKHGVLPLTSFCNMNCLFCSHRFNPPEVRVWRLPPRPLEEVESSLAWLAGPRVVIGESVTKIVEGEPFTHPQVMEILRLIRRRFPSKRLSITTNGSLLDEEKVAALANLEPIELTISLNSGRPAGRTFLMHDQKPELVLAALPQLGRAGLTFHGSLVALPHLVGWEDIRLTIEFLAEAGASSIRLFLPGFTRLTPPELRFSPSLPGELRNFVAEMKKKVPVPLLLEPPFVEGLEAVVEGVIVSSPAARAGVQPGDIVTAVNGVIPFSRVEAFRLAQDLERPRLTLVRDGAFLEVTLEKKAGQPSGLTMLYDLDPATLTAIEAALEGARTKGRGKEGPGKEGRGKEERAKEERATEGRAKEGRGQERQDGASDDVLLLASTLGSAALQAGLLKKGIRVALEVVENRFFGGSIGAAGLLVVEDFMAAIRERQIKSSGRYRRVLIPGRPFDERGRDLVGRSYWEIEEATGVQVQVVDW